MFIYEIRGVWIYRPARNVKVAILILAWMMHKKPCGLFPSAWYPRLISDSLQLVCWFGMLISLDLAKSCFSNTVALAWGNFTQHRVQVPTTLESWNYIMLIVLGVWYSLWQLNDKYMEACTAAWDLQSYMVAGLKAGDQEHSHTFYYRTYLLKRTRT